MKAQHRTPRGEDAYQANLLTHRCFTPAKRKAVSAVPSEHGREQELDPLGCLGLTVPEHVAAVSARTHR